MGSIDMQLLLLSALWAIALTGLAGYTLRVGMQITYVTLADGRRQERRLPLAFRLLLPLVPNVAPLFRSAAMSGARQNAARRLTAAGFDELLSAEEFLSLRILLPLVLGLLWLALVAALGVAANPDSLFRKLLPVVYAIGPLALMILPDQWLRQALANRHRRIQRALPFVLDLLTLSVEAGMDFMTALQRNVERSSVDALGEELIRVVREIQVGKTRREALRDLADRVGLPDLKSVVNALVQADELGVSIGSILRIQADQMRQRRFENAERLANQAPVKMLGPLLLFIFPSVFFILLGPVIYRLIQQGF